MADDAAPTAASHELSPEPETHTASSPDGREHVSLTHSPLDVLASLARVKDPAAGAVVMFAGTTRNTFEDAQVKHLSYTSYAPLALRTLSAIAASVRATHGLVAISLTHRLGVVPVGEESVLVCVSAAHRGPAWRAGEEALEAVKARVEVWKREVFADGRESVGRDGEPGAEVSLPEGAEEDADGEVGVWRANENGEGEREGRVTGRMLASAAAEGHDHEHEHEDDHGHEHGQEHGHEREDDDTKKEQDEHTYAGHDGERRRIAEESRREMEMEMEKGWGGA